MMSFLTLLQKKTFIRLGYALSPPFEKSFKIHQLPRYIPPHPSSRKEEEKSSYSHHSKISKGYFLSSKTYQVLSLVVNMFPGTR